MGSWVRVGRVAVLLIIFLSSPVGVAARQSSAAFDARRAGLALLREGIAAMGGLEALSSVASVRIEAEVTQYQVGQSSRSAVLSTPLGTSVYSFIRDLSNGEWYIESSVSRSAPGPRLRVVNGLFDQFQYDLRNNAVLEIPGGLGLEVLAERLPYAPGALLDALRRSETVRLLGPSLEDSRAERVLTYADSAGRQVALTFDDRSLLASVATIESHAQMGDLTRATHYSDYRPIGDLVLPFGTRNTLGAFVTVETRIFDIAPGAVVDRSLFARPEGASTAPAGAAPSVAGGEQKVERIAPGIYQLLNVVPLYNVMLVEQEDRVIVIEAPGDETAYAAVRDSVSRRLSGKRVGTLVLTHHHFDHTSALRFYLTDGTTIIAPAGDAEFVHLVARAPRLAEPGGVSGEPVIELVHGRHMVGSGPNRFELIDVGPNPHADEILVAYFPEHKLLWVPDIYGYLPGYTPPPLLLSFADRLEALDLDVAVIATAHTELSSIDEYREMVRTVRAASGRATASQDDPSRAPSSLS